MRTRSIPKDPRSIHSETGSFSSPDSLERVQLKPLIEGKAERGCEGRGYEHEGMSSVFLTFK